MKVLGVHSSERAGVFCSLGVTCLLFCLFLGGGCVDQEKQDDSLSPAIRALPRPSPRPDAGRRLRFAVAAMISPATTFTVYEEVLQSIAEKAGRPFTFVQRRSYKEVNDLLLGGQVDMAFICSGAYVALPPDAGIELLAVPVVKGETAYHSLIIAREGSDFDGFTDLRGKRFAFTDSLSNSGYYYPLSRLQELRERPGTFFESTVFTGSHDRSITAVYRKLADAAAVDSLVFDRIVTEDSRYIGKLKVIEQSPGFPIPPVVAPTSVSSELRAIFKQALLTLHETREGRDRLAKMGIERFVPGDPASYSVIRKVAEHAQDVLGP